jgi:hypothetical protein
MRRERTLPRSRDYRVAGMNAVGGVASLIRPPSSSSECSPSRRPCSRVKMPRRAGRTSPRPRLPRHARCGRQPVAQGFASARSARGVQSSRRAGRGPASADGRVAAAQAVRSPRPVGEQEPPAVHSSPGGNADLSFTRTHRDARRRRWSLSAAVSGAEARAARAS